MINNYSTSLVGFNRTKNMCKVMTVAIQIVYLIFSLDFGYLKPKSLTMKSTLHLFTLIKFVIGFLSVYQIYLHTNILMTLWYLYHFLLYLICVSILSFTKADAMLCNFNLELQQIDLKLNTDASEYNLEFKLLVAIMLCFVYRLTLTPIVCLFSDHCFKPYWATYVMVSLYLSLEICYVCFAFIFYATKCRMKTLYSSIAIAESNFTLFQFIYKQLIDTTEKYKTAFHLLYSVSLICIMPGVLISTFIVVQNIILHQIDFWNSFAQFAVLFETFMMITIPALAADALTTQVEKIKFLLHDKHLQNRDGGQTKEIMWFINYVEARGCQYRVFKMIPLNANLLGMMLSFCVTYLIVILQFTHVY